MTTQTCSQCGVESEECRSVPKSPPVPFVTLSLCPACYGKRQGMLSDQLANLREAGLQAKGGKQ